MKYYGLPLKISSFIQHDSPDKQVDDEKIKRKDKESLSLRESIKVNLQLILRTRLKSCRFDPEFGYLGWSKDFENISKESNWEREIKEDFEGKIYNYEKRLKEVRVQINLKKANDKSALQNHQFLVKVEAKLQETKEPFEFEEFMYFSPIRLSSSRY